MLTKSEKILMSLNSK